MSEKQYVVFRLDGQQYGAPIDVVREITYVTQITHLPNTPHFVDGVMNLRGEVLPVVDLRKRLGMGSREHSHETRLMILNLGSQSAALVVDGADQVLSLRDEQIAAPDGSYAMAGQAYVMGLARLKDQLVILLDLPQLMETVSA